MPRILIVEDEKETADSLGMWLSREGYDILHVDNGPEALERLLSEGFDLAIVDWELPGISGLDVCRGFRSRGGKIPLMMLTARSAIHDKLDGLDTGADDYVTKPFSLRELSSRVRALLRRPVNLKGNILELGELRLDPLNHTVYRNGEELELMPRDFALLEFFMKNPDVVFSPEALLQRVWGNEVEAGPDALRSSIKRIRKKIDSENESEESLIENVPRIGYRMRIR